MTFTQASNASHVFPSTAIWSTNGTPTNSGFENPVSIMLPRVEAMEGVESASTLATGHPERSQVFSDRTVSIKPPSLIEDYLDHGSAFHAHDGDSACRRARLRSW